MDTISSLTNEQFDFNVQEFKRLLLSTKRVGIEKVIKDLEQEGYFNANCYSHDRFKGGTLNHCLWVTKLGLESIHHLHKTSPASKRLHEYSVIIVCLLHDVCDTQGFHSIPTHRPSGKLLHGKRSELILSRYRKPEKKGRVFSGIELNAISRHMHPKGIHNGVISTRNATDLRVLLHYILKDSDGRAVEFYRNIPYGTKPRNPLSLKVNDSNLTIPINENGLSISVHQNDSGHYFIPQLGEIEDARFYITRYPDYRDSFLLAQSSNDHLWRSYRIHSDNASIEKVCLIGSQTIDGALKLMKDKDRRFLIRVLYNDCFEKVYCEDYFK